MATANSVGVVSMGTIKPSGDKPDAISGVLAKGSTTKQGQFTPNSAGIVSR